MADHPVPALSVTVERCWDVALMQTGDLCPAGGHAALLSYRSDPWPDDGGLPYALAACLGLAFSRCGRVAGRWFDEASPVGDAELRSPPPRGLIRRVTERMQGRWPASLVITQSAGVVVQLFEQGWGLQYQALLVLDPASDADPQKAFDALSTLRQWRHFAFPRPVEVLVAPGVDGDVILIAARSGPGLAYVLAGVERACMEASIGFKAA